MKIFLSLILCSYVGDICMEPYVWPESYNSTFDCMIAGYEEAINKMQEIGREEVNNSEKFEYAETIEEEETLSLLDKEIEMIKQALIRT